MFQTHLLGREIVMTADIEILEDLLPTYLDCCIRETLRLYPAAPQLTRVACCDFFLKEYRISAGVVVLIDIVTMQREPVIWGDDALEYRPERFSPEESQGRPSLAWIPFGMGAKVCLGGRLAISDGVCGDYCKSGCFCQHDVT